MHHHLLLMVPANGSCFAVWNKQNVLTTDVVHTDGTTSGTRMGNSEQQCAVVLCTLTVSSVLVDFEDKLFREFVVAAFLHVDVPNGDTAHVCTG